MIRVIIADDHRLVRRGIKEILKTASDIVVCGEAAGSEELLLLLRQDQPDVLILDLAMPGLSGTELIKYLCAAFSSLRILVLSMHNEAQFAALAIRAGALGYVTKDADPEILLLAIHRIAANGKFIDPALVEAMVFAPQATKPLPHEHLSDREIQVLGLLVAGKSLNLIAGELNLSPKTISSHKMRIMQKLGVTNNADLMRFAIQNNIAKA
ncbi:MAG: response regulator transcription factor [Rhodocyclaceae bacterium]|nr:response regulator transcription factor [Rhodocyclaceae bacterium]MDZ4216000.1 response regulator transcription factor [Rhodocyclaceae bacterium]